MRGRYCEITIEEVLVKLRVVALVNGMDIRKLYCAITVTRSPGPLPPADGGRSTAACAANSSIHDAGAARCAAQHLDPASNSDSNCRDVVSGARSDHEDRSTSAAKGGSGDRAAFSLRPITNGTPLTLISPRALLLRRLFQFLQVRPRRESL